MSKEVRKMDEEMDLKSDHQEFAESKVKRRNKRNQEAFTRK